MNNYGSLVGFKIRTLSQGKRIVLLGKFYFLTFSGLVNSQQKKVQEIFWHLRRPEN